MNTIIKKANPFTNGNKCVKIGLFLLFSMHISGCSRIKEKAINIDNSVHIDTTVSVYGPYLALKLPIQKGIKVSNPIQISVGPGGYMYVTNQNGEVYSLRDTDDDGIEDTAVLYCDVKELGLRSPSGFSSKGDTVYIGTAQEIRSFLDMNRDGKADTSWVFFNNIPTSEHPYEWTCGLNFGPDGWLYFSLSTDSWNAAPSPDENGFRGSILRISPDGKKVEKVATGIRSVYGISFNSEGEMYFTDNEGGGNPQEELNRLVVNDFYGHNPSKYTFHSIHEPDFILQTEVAPSGIEFNTSGNDFGGTGGDLFVAYYGPGERWLRGGIGRIKVEKQADGSFLYTEYPVADIPKISDLAFGNDGSLYLAHHGKADYWYNTVYSNQGAIYKLVYDSTLRKKPIKPRLVADKSFSDASVDRGKQLFAERACLGCHSVDGSTELLGPNLKDVGNRLSRNEILEEILKPSERIKPSMMAQRIYKEDGKTLLGRVVHADEEHISLMLIGNHVVKIPREEILKAEDEKKSLMYEGLLNRLSEEEVNFLLDYLVSMAN